MAALMTHDGHNYALQQLVESGLVLHLYANAMDPTPLDGPADYAEPQTGYRPIPMPGPLWNVANGQATSKEIAFKFTGPAGPVEGWYVTNADGTVVVAAERLPERLTIRAAGDAVFVTVVLRVR